MRELFTKPDFLIVGREEQRFHPPRQTVLLKSHRQNTDNRAPLRVLRSQDATLKTDSARIIKEPRKRQETENWKVEGARIPNR